jgi:hypothetical protein
MNKVSGIWYLLSGFVGWCLSGFPLIDDDEGVKGSVRG